MPSLVPIWMFLLWMVSRMFYAWHSAPGNASNGCSITWLQMTEWVWMVGGAKNNMSICAASQTTPVAAACIIHWVFFVNHNHMSKERRWRRWRKFSTSRGDTKRLQLNWGSMTTSSQDFCVSVCLSVLSPQYRDLVLYKISWLHLLMAPIGFL